MHGIANKFGFISAHLLPPVCKGKLEEKTFAIYPFKQDLHTGIESKLRRIYLKQRIMDLLMQVAEASMEIVPEENALRIVTERFGLLAEIFDSTAMQLHIKNGLNAVRNGIWQPVHMLDHNDLWLGNILVGKSWHDRKNFYLIDWTGANMNSFGVHDLLTFSQSAGSSKREVSAMLDKLAIRPNMDRNHLTYQYLMRIGDLSGKLDDFPLERFSSKVNTELAYLS